MDGVKTMGEFKDGDLLPTLSGAKMEFGDNPPLDPLTVIVFNPLVIIFIFVPGVKTTFPFNEVDVGVPLDIVVGVAMNVFGVFDRVSITFGDLRPVGVGID